MQENAKGNNSNLLIKFFSIRKSLFVNRQRQAKYNNCTMQKISCELTTFQIDFVQASRTSLNDSTGRYTYRRDSTQPLKIRAIL